MDSTTAYAFRVVVAVDEQQREHVVAGVDLAQAAMAAQDRIGPDVRVVHMAELGELLAGAEDRSDPAPKPAPPAPAELQAEPAAPQPVPSAPQAVLPGTRRDQLLEVLRQHGGPLHLDVVAVALDIKRGHADEIAKQAVNAGVVQRVGNRTGKIELVEPETVESETPTVIETVPTVDPPAPVARKPRRSRPTRIERLVELLRGRTEPVHLDEIAAALDMTRKNADSAVRIAAKAWLVRRVGSRTGLVELVNVAEVEAPAAEPVPEVSPAPATRTAKPSASPTRVERLVAFLQSRPGAVHATEIAEALATTRGNADSAVRAGVRAGLVRRVGSRTGLVELVPTADTADPVAEVSAPVVEPATAPAASPAGQTRVEQLVALLRERGGPVHTSEIGEVLGTKPGNVQNIIAQGVKAGAVHRVGHRTGLAELAGPPSGLERGQDEQGVPGVTGAAAEPQWLDPASLDGIQKRVFDALVELGGLVTAKAVADQLGCRPREVGNALALLVEGGLVARQRGAGTSGGTSSYSLLQ